MIDLKLKKEIYLVDAQQSVTECKRPRTVKDFEDSGVQISYKVSGWQRK